jgi:flagellar biosynthesis protein FliQ
MDLVAPAQDALSLALALGTPLLAAALAAAILIGVFQSALQSQDPSVSFVAKLGALALVLFFSAHSAALQLTGFTESVMRGIAQVAR